MGRMVGNQLAGVIGDEVIRINEDDGVAAVEDPLIVPWLQPKLIPPLPPLGFQGQFGQSVGLNVKKLSNEEFLSIVGDINYSFSRVLAGYRDWETDRKSVV